MCGNRVELRGTITSATLAGTIQTSDGRAGFDAAQAVVTITLLKNGVSATYAASMTLLQEPDGWKLLSIDPHT